MKKESGITKIESELSEYNSKTTDYFKFKQYILEKNRLNTTISWFYNHPTNRKMKLRQFIYSKKSEDNFVNRIGKTFGGNGRQVIIGYGNWSRTDQMKNFLPTLGKGLRKLIHKKYSTLTVNEAYTSKRCSDCNHDLENYVDKGGKKVHRLLVCKCMSCENKRITFKSRDLNAAINILKLTKFYLQFGYRDPLMCREI